MILLEIFRVSKEPAPPHQIRTYPPHMFPHRTIFP